MKIILSLIASSILLSTSSYAGLYRWVDEKGNVFYSDKVPPSSAKLGHVELNEQGLKTKVELSIEEKLKIAKEKELREKELAEKQKRDKAEQLLKMQNDQLLAVYSTRKELINVYEGKIKMSEASIRLLKNRHKVLSERLTKTEVEYEKMKNPQFKKTLEGKIDDMLDGLRVYQQAITENMVEKNKLEQQFDEDLKRYDELVTSQKDEVSEPKNNTLLSKLKQKSKNDKADDSDHKKDSVLKKLIELNKGSEAKQSNKNDKNSKLKNESELAKLS